MIDQRSALEQLIRRHGSDYSALSRLLGRNAAYIQQFIRRGTPRKLDADDVARLAEFFGVDPSELGGKSSSSGDRLVRIPRLDVGASAGAGAFNEGESVTSHIAFEPLWLRRLTASGPSQLAFIRVQGDSMAPTLVDGDDILVDEADGLRRLRDGIYVLRRDDSLMVKRLATSPFARTITIKSDNLAYPEWRDCALDSVDIIGRVIWSGRRLA